MRSLFFENSLELEVNVIGYHNQGESVLFFIKTDGYIAYAGLVDCYKTSELNAVEMLLEKEQVKALDFVCWTHPHDDHTIGLNEIWDKYCNEDTCFCCTDIVKADGQLYSEEAMALFENMLEINKSRKKKKMRLMYLKDATQAERLWCSNGEVRYEFKIQSFAPNSALLGERVIGDKDAQGNAYSIGLFLFLGECSIMLTGDVENQTIRRIPEGDLEYPVDYIKIPHHGSKSANFLPDKMDSLNIETPNIAVTTLFRRFDLPQTEVIDKYFNWGCEEIYATGNIQNAVCDNLGYGIIRTTFDILEKREYIAETELIGDAVTYEKELSEDVC